MPTDARTLQLQRYHIGRMTDLLKEKDAEITRLREALEWYGEKVRESAEGGDISSMTDAYQALEADAGARARAAIATEPKP